MDKTTITIDTNILDKNKIAQLEADTKNKPVEIAVVSVSDREVRGTDIKPLPVKILETGVWDESEWGNFVWGRSVGESFILGESQLGTGKLGSTQTADMLEELLKTMSNGSFPKIGKRDNLTKGEKHLLRDAMILEAHCREKRDILVSDDVKAYIGKTGDLRVKLESLCKTKIMTFDEFLAWLKQP